MASLALVPETVAAPPCRLSIKRTLDASALNEVANHPEVRPWLGGEGPLDLGETVAAIGPDGLANFALVTDGGGFLLIRHEPGTYEVHSMFLPEARTRTVRAMRAGMAYMFTQTDCEKLITKVPDGNDRAANLARLGGFRSMFRREECWKGGGGIAHLGITIDEWAMACKDLEADGEWFHTRLEEAKREAGSEMPAHAHDAAHERAVGAAVQMMRAGNVAKGLAFYNRWARFAGYAEIIQLQDVPAVLDLGDAVIELRGDDMGILLCR